MPKVVPEQKTIIPPESPPSSATTSDLNPDHSQTAAHNDTFVKLYEYDIGNYVENIRSLSDAEKHDLINNVLDQMRTLSLKRQRNIRRI